MRSIRGHRAVQLVLRHGRPLGHPLHVGVAVAGTAPCRPPPRAPHRRPPQPPAAFHDAHHEFFHCNFGQNLLLWDRLHGTARVEGRRYDEATFGGRGRGAPPL